MTDQEKSILEFNFSKMPEEDLNALLKQTKAEEDEAYQLFTRRAASKANVTSINKL